MKNKPTWILIAFLANLALLPLVTGALEGRAQERSWLLSISIAARRRLPGGATAVTGVASFVWNCLTTKRTCQRREQSANSRLLHDQ